LKTSTHDAHGFKTTHTKEILPCWIFGELYKARNDFLHGNTINGERLTVKPSQRSLFLYTGILYRLALTGFLDLSFKRPVPLTSDTEAFAAYISDRMEYRQYQADIEAALTTILYTEEDYRPRSRGELKNLPPPPPPSTDLSDLDELAS
jgi:hypothetical protein